MSNVTSAVRQGFRLYQEDYHFYKPIKCAGDRGWLIAVMDGHSGEGVAEFCANNIERFFSLQNANRSEEALRELVSALNSETFNFRSGSTLSVACILENSKKASIAILGDSPVVALDKNGKLHISPEHNVRSNMDERKAAERRGGVYANGYIWTSNGYFGLQMSRALGDAHLGRIISHEPDIYTISDPVWVLVASDGLFDPDHQNTRALFDKLEQYAKQGLNADELMRWAEERGLKDNATALVWHL